jgi:hypothetical protein
VHNLAIFGNQIEIERIFSVVDILTSLRICKCGVENSNLLVMIYNNWSDDARVKCRIVNVDATKFCAIEVVLSKFHEVELGEVGIFKEE